MVKTVEHVPNTEDPLEAEILANFPKYLSSWKNWFKTTMSSKPCFRRPPCLTIQTLSPKDTWDLYSKVPAKNIFTDIDWFVLIQLQSQVQKNLSHKLWSWINIINMKGLSQKKPMKMYEKLQPTISGIIFRGAAEKVFT